MQLPHFNTGIEIKMKGRKYGRTEGVEYISEHAGASNFGV